jgi:hypothetical protein
MTKQLKTVGISPTTNETIVNSYLQIIVNFQKHRFLQICNNDLCKRQANR